MTLIYPLPIPNSISYFIFKLKIQQKELIISTKDHKVCLLNL